MPRRHNRQRHHKPDWFDLNKYELLKSITLEGWSYELNARQQLIEECINSSSIDEAKIDIFERCWNAAIKNHIRQYGSVFGLLYPELPPESLSEIPLDKEWIESGLKTNCVRLSTCGDIERLQLKNHSGSEDTPPGLMSSIPYNIANSHVGGFQEGDLNLTININAPNPVLIRDFENVLKAARDHLGSQSKTRVSDAKIESWLSQQLVPYLDLYIWMQETGVEIPSDIISEWLYPELDESDENKFDINDEGRRVRRTTHSNAMELVSAEFLIKLESILKNQGVFKTSKNTK